MIHDARAHPSLWRTPSFLEEELARRYREAAPATLALLQERCEAVAKELLALEDRIQACTDVAALRRAGARCGAVWEEWSAWQTGSLSNPAPEGLRMRQYLWHPGNHEACSC
jgi:hypothetical protein